MEATYLKETVGRRAKRRSEAKKDGGWKEVRGEKRK